MAVVVATPEFNIAKFPLAPLDSTAPGLLWNIITEVPFGNDFGETAAKFVFSGDGESTPWPYSAFLATVLQNNHSCAPTIARGHRFTIDDQSSAHDGEQKQLVLLR